MSGANLVETCLQRTILDGSRVFGVSVWKTDLDDARQQNLRITPDDEADIVVDNIKIAQFLYLLLNNAEIRDVIDTITSKAVLILGRFTEERKRVLDALRTSLRRAGYVPILFDFEEPKAGTLMETVSTLAHLARFVIVDITEPKSVPQELQGIVPHQPSLPIQPIVHSSEREWGMFSALRAYSSVLPLYRYDCLDTLLAGLDANVIEPAERKVKDLARGRGGGASLPADPAAGARH